MISNSNQVSAAKFSKKYRLPDQSPGFSEKASAALSPAFHKPDRF